MRDRAHDDEGDHDRRRARWSGLAQQGALLWAGLTIGISFIEAPVKFRAPTLTLPVGLDVGRHVFSASHVVQLALAAVTLAAAALARAPRSARGLLIAAAAVLAVEALALMPMLEARAQTVIDGGVPPGPSPHVAYVALEVVKLVALLAGAALARRGDAAPAWRRPPASSSRPSIAIAELPRSPAAGTPDVVARSSDGPRGARPARRARTVIAAPTTKPCG